VGAADLPRHPLEVKLLYVAIVPANACQHTKFQLSSSISFGDMRGSENEKRELLISPDAPSGHIFIQSVSTRKCLYKFDKFQLRSSISFGNMRGSHNKKWALLISPDTLSGQIFTCLQVCLPEYQISTF